MLSLRQSPVDEAAEHAEAVNLARFHVDDIENRGFGHYGRVVDSHLGSSPYVAIGIKQVHAGGHVYSLGEKEKLLQHQLNVARVFKDLQRAEISSNIMIEGLENTGSPIRGIRSKVEQMRSKHRHQSLSFEEKWGFLLFCRATSKLNIYGLEEPLVFNEFSFFNEITDLLKLTIRTPGLGANLQSRFPNGMPISEFQNFITGTGLTRQYIREALIEVFNGDPIMVDFDSTMDALNRAQEQLSLWAIALRQHSIQDVVDKVGATNPSVTFVLGAGHFEEKLQTPGGQSEPYSTLQELWREADTSFVVIKPAGLDEAGGVRSLAA